MAENPANLKDPEQNSEFARSKRLSQEKGVAPGVDPVTGERAAITYRQLYNEMNGDEARATETFRDIAAAGGYGDIDPRQHPDQALDIRGLSRSVEESKKAAEKGVDLQGRPLDLYGKRRMEQHAQHQDNLVNAVGEVLERIKKG
jgi:hypothetical protein